jgi:hypothetical protein
MWSLHHPILFLLLYKDVLGMLIQAGLLLATFALIRVGAKQAKAADAQANAATRQVRAADAQASAAQMQLEFARQQVEAAEAQLANSKSQFQEQVRQGLAASRPNFKFRDGDPGFSTSPVVIRNTGPGVAYRITWRFVNPKNRQLENSVYEIGTLGANQEMEIPWEFDTQNPRLQTRMMIEHEIRVECMDGAGRLYYTRAKMNGQGDFITHSEQIEPEG